MAFNGTGTFVRIYNWVTDKINSVPITASRMDTEMDGFATGLSNCITKDGQTTVTANIPMNSHKFTGLAVGSARTDSIALSQVQDGTYTYMGTTGGSADAYTLSPSPSITAYVAPMRFVCKIAATNTTTTPYLQISGIGTPASDAVIKKLASDKSEVAVVAGDMVANGLYEFQRNSGNTAWILLNPENPISTGVVESDLINNLSISTSVSSNALTIALKTKAGNDPSTSEPVQISFRSSTATSGVYTTRLATTATSLVISSGSTLGTVSAVAAILYVYALDNSGTVELAVSSYLFQDNSIQSSTAEGGAGAADAANVLYSTTARSNVPVRLIGMIDITETTAGTWASNATTVTSSPLSAVITATSGRYFIESKTASSSSSVAFTNLNSNYSRYEIEFQYIIPATNGAGLIAQFSTNNGSSYINSSYLSAMLQGSTSDAPAGQTNNTTRFTLVAFDGDANKGLSNASTAGLCGTLKIFNPSSTAAHKQVSWSTRYVNNSAFSYEYYTEGGGRYTGATSAVNAIRFKMSTANADTDNGNIASGVFKLYGIR